MNIEEGKALNHLIHMEERIIPLLKSLEGQSEISEKEKSDLYPSGSKPVVLYGLAKIHKALEDGTSSFRPILSAIGTPTYNLTKLCDQRLKPLISNDYTIKDSFSFAKEVLDFDASCFMASFDIQSLFTNIAPTETLNLCVQNLYRNQTHVNNLTKSSFYKLLKITMFESFFIFDGKFYEQCDGVAMGSPLEPTLANVFMCHFENIWLENYPSHFKPIVYRRFVDDTFLLFLSKDHIEKFRNYLNKQHKNIKFTSEIEKNGSLSFSEIRMSRENNKKQLKTIFRSKCRLNTLFRFKDSFEKKIRSGIIYRYTCSNCKVTYYGKTFHHFYTRGAKHMVISNLTGKCLKNVMQSAIFDHLLQCNCTRNFDNFDILAAESNKFKLLLRESLLIKCDKPSLNRTIKSFPLELLD